MNQYSLAIIGPREMILGFKALGLDPVYADSSETAIESLYTLKKEKGKYAIIFIMEDMISGISPEDYKKLTADPLPAVISLPSHLGSTGYGLTRLKGIVEKAVGMDILN